MADKRGLGAGEIKPPKRCRDLFKGYFRAGEVILKLLWMGTSKLKGKSDKVSIQGMCIYDYVLLLITIAFRTAIITLIRQILLNYVLTWWSANLLTIDVLNIPKTSLLH